MADKKVAANPLVTPKWKQRSADTHPKHVQRLKEAQEPKFLVLGSSMIERFETSGKSEMTRLTEKYKCVLAGVGGDGIEHMLWRVEEGLIAACPSSITTVVLMCGTNNIEQRSADQVYEGTVHLIQKIQEKRADLKIILFGLLPRDSQKKGLTHEALMERIKTLNTKLAGLDGTNGIKFYNFFNLLTKTGLVKDDGYFDDHVHLNSAGYSIFAKQLYVALEKE
jgi:lysophospholipase L1-like esterase